MRLNEPVDPTEGTHAVSRRSDAFSRSPPRWITDIARQDMLHVHHENDAPIPGLLDAIAHQQAEGGRLVLYRRMWSAFIISEGQNRIEHLSPQQSRILAGLKHSAFTLVLGIWSISSLLTVPLILIINSRGGIDVTARFSDSSIDPLRALPPDIHQSERDLKTAQWFYIVFLFGTAIACYFIFSG